MLSSAGGHQATKEKPSGHSPGFRQGPQAPPLTDDLSCAVRRVAASPGRSLSGSPGLRASALCPAVCSSSHQPCLLWVP